jgi:hypothetical protein
MNTDPEYHESAAEWLDGTADEGTRRILSAQLRDPERAGEFAGLCRTEALLRGMGRSDADRRAELAAILAKPWWLMRARDAVRQPMVRRSAAAAVAVALITWALWPPDRNDREGISLRPRPVAAVSPLEGAPKKVRQQAGQLEMMDMESVLRSRFAGVALRGSLAEAALLLSRALALPGGRTPKVDVRAAGDAPVHLNLPVGLPAWTLLQMMAAQTGTEFSLDGDVLVFAEGNRSADTLESTLTLPSGNFRNLLLLLTGKPMDPNLHEESLRWESVGAPPIGEGRLLLERDTESVRVSGPARSLQAIEVARRGMQEVRGEVVVQLTLMKLAPGAASPSDGQRWDPAAPQWAPDLLRGIRADAWDPQEGNPPLMVRRIMKGSEFGQAMEQLGKEETVTTVAAPSMAMQPFQNAMLTVGGTRVAILAVPTGMDRMALHLGIDEGMEGGPEFPGYGSVIEMASGAGGLLRRPPGDDGSIDCLAIAPVMTDPSGKPIELELPQGIPAGDRPGMLQSPYAPEAGMVDVEGLAPGTQVKCPYSGLTFRIP